MTRLGLGLDPFKQVLELLIKHTEIKCEGIYSHFATADEGDLSYAFDQEKKFKRILDLAKKLDYKINNIHFSNSGAALNIEQDYCNIIRVGMLLYGALPSDGLKKTLPMVCPGAGMRMDIFTIMVTNIELLVEFVWINSW